MYRKHELTASILILILLAFFPVLVSAPTLAEKAPGIAPGTTIKVRIIDSLNSGTAQTGDTFHGTLEEPIMVEGKELYPKGADVTGRVTDVHRSGRLSDPGKLELVLATIASAHMASSIEVEPLTVKGTSHAKSNVGKIGGGAALGAIIGGLAGGGKGAAIGAGVGGAAGTGAAAATGKREAVVESEAVLSFITTQNAPVSGGAPAVNSTKAVNSTEAENSANPRHDDDNEPVPSTNNFASAFTARDRRVIRTCVSEHALELPAGLTQREELPSGNERNIRSGGRLPPELQKDARPLPLACEQQLSELPGELERVVYNGRVLLINDTTNRILDLFYLDETR